MLRLLISLIILLSAFLPAVATQTFTILQWNVWQEGTCVQGGYDAIVEEIVRLKPDFVTFSEVRNYHDKSFARRIEKSLKTRGETYYSFHSYDTGLLSRYPITDSLVVYPCVDDHGSVHRLLCEAKGVKWAVFTAHLDYLNDTYYEVRGYDGSTWKEIPVLTDSAEVMRRKALSKRDDGIRAAIEQAAKDEENGYRIIIGGDFNEPSLLDWTDATRYMYDHHGLVIPWTVTSLLNEAGYVDVYRAVWPNPLTHPGFTYPADNPSVAIDRLTWAPLADERERIDYIFVKGKGISVKEAHIFGPERCIAYSQRRATPGAKDIFISPLGIWPTDHKGVWAVITVK